MATQWANPEKHFRNLGWRTMMCLIFEGFPVSDQISASVVLLLPYSAHPVKITKGELALHTRVGMQVTKRHFLLIIRIKFLCYTSVKIIITCSGAKDTSGENQKESTWGKLQLRKSSLLSITNIIYFHREHTGTLYLKAPGAVWLPLFPPDFR